MHGSSATGTRMILLYSVSGRLDLYIILLLSVRRTQTHHIQVVCMHLCLDNTFIYFFLFVFLSYFYFITHDGFENQK